MTSKLAAGSLKAEACVESTLHLPTNKVKEVKAKVTQTQMETLAQVQTYVGMELREAKRQEANAPRSILGGLPEA